MTQSNRLRSDERGIVSIMVSMIMMLVISLIVLGFAQVARQNQRASLDRQLSTQAFYAAESGVNSAIKYLKETPGYQKDTLTTPDCQGFLNDTIGASKGTLGSGVKYNCLMVNPTPPRLSTAPLTEDTSTVWHLKENNKFDQMTFNWQANSTSSFTGGTNSCTAGTFTSYGTWKCSLGVLRVDLFNAAAGFSDASTTDPANNITLYLIPSTSGAVSANITPASADPNSPAAAQVIKANCPTTPTGPKQCKIALNLPANRQSTEYYARLSMIYQKADDVSLTGHVLVSGAANFIDGQAIIDSTGKAQDQLRRIQVVVPLIRTSAQLPNYGILSTNTICKQFTVIPGSSLSVPSCTNP